MLAGDGGLADSVHRHEGAHERLRFLLSKPREVDLQALEARGAFYEPLVPHFRSSGP